jgi:serine/threonine protein kinase
MTGYDRATMPLREGEQVQGWEVEAVIGRGAMATVYRARHRALGTRAALKVLDRVDPTTEQRLLNEGRAQGSVDHPGIVSVLDHVRVGDHTALVLEHVEGGDLRALLAQGPLPSAVALDLFRQVASALAAAHAAGLVHRDLKPSNVLITRAPDGAPVAKVGDFGLVKWGDGDLTATHAMVGTPRYMAPEQMRAARLVDARADVFALGCLLYELVTGRQAFPSDDLVELYTRKISGHYAAPDRLVPDLPAPVVAAIRGALEGAPNRRIQSCEQLLTVLDGAPWAPPAEDTVDGATGIALCPACGAPVEAADCAACGAASTLAGRWRLAEDLSQGPHTRVWRALDLKEARFVTVRALLDPAADPAAVNRFRRGADVACELDHPQVARDLGPAFEEHARLWEVRDHVEGRPLSRVAEARRLSEDEVLAMVLELCSPLAYLAERSPPVVHGGLSPSNVIVGDDGRPVLIDFARARDGGGDASLQDVPDSAPEQWVGEATPASDVFGLGALAVTLLTRRGAHTVTAATRWANTSVRPEVRALIDAMLADAPAARPSIREVAARLRALRRPVPARGSAPLRGAMIGGTGFLMAACASAIPVCAGLFVVVASIEDGGPGEPALGEATPEATLPAGPLPAAMRIPGDDLADHPPPGADCGEPFDVELVVSEGNPPGPYPVFATTCGGRTTLLGRFDAGEVATVRLPGVSRLEIPLASSTHSPWVRAPGPEPIRLQGWLRRGVAQDADGSPLTAATRFPARQSGWARDSAGRPQLDRPREMGDEPWFPADAASPVSLGVPPFEPVAVSDAQGVFRLKLSMVGREPGARLAPLGPIREILVTDSAGPIADAEVTCLGSQDWASIEARTDDRGIARCAAGERAPAWAVVQAPGRVAQVTPLLEGTVGVQLPPARTFHVGCAGPSGDLCTSMVVPPVCAGGRSRSPGICRFVGDHLACQCAPDAERIEHDTYGAVPIGQGDEVWFDLRRVAGRVSGQILDGAQCALELTSRAGPGVATVADADGHYVFPFVPEGEYAVRARCRAPWTEVGRPRVTADAPEVTLAPIAAPEPVQPMTVTAAPEPEPEVERTLSTYAFPSLPQGWSDPQACTLRVTVDPSGRLADAEARLCPEALQPLALEAVGGWRWEPGPETTRETLNVPFR